MDQGIRQWLVGVNYKISNANTCCVGAMRNPQPSKNDEHPKLSATRPREPNNKNAPTTTTNERGGRDWRAIEQSTQYQIRNGNVLLRAVFDWNMAARPG